MIPRTHERASAHPSPVYTGRPSPSADRSIAALLDLLEGDDEISGLLALAQPTAPPTRIPVWRRWCTRTR